MAFSLGKEKEEGPVEYKLKISGGKQKIWKLAAQIKYRLAEGGGEAIFEIGVSDDGIPVGISESEMKKSIYLLGKAANSVGASIKVIRTVKGKKGLVSEVLIRRKVVNEPIFIFIPIIGNVDSGKSTTISVLTHGILDDGNGSAMARIARHPHEIISGRTSSISTALLGFDEKGEPVNYMLPMPSEDEVYLRSSKIICFIDLAGHERYFKTTLKGICSHEPDYGMFVVGGNAGLIGMAKEQFAVLHSLKIPIFTVITKIDIAPEGKLKEVMKQIKSLAELPAINKIVIPIRNINDVVVASKHMPSGRIMPVFQISNKTGENIHLLRTFLNLLPPRLKWDEKTSRKFMMYVEEKFNVKGVGPVVYGLILQGSVSVGDSVWIGPDENGEFKLVRVKSIHTHRVPVDRASAGQLACLALSDIKWEEILKGMVVLDRLTTPRSTRKFKAKILVLHHPTLIKRGYQAVVHINAARQTVVFEDMSKEPLRTGDIAEVTLRFLYRPLYVPVNEKIILREGRTRAIGIVTKLL
mgnify:CR=1 FL=1